MCPPDEPFSGTGRGEAVALTYSAGDAAPRVVAKGRGLIAQEIIERAREAGVYVHESPEMVALLMQVDLDERIPPQLYVAVAELLAWLYRVEQGDMSAPPPDHSRLPGLPATPEKPDRDT
ncbi:EscU/YscU/HrcU family type III secretion system export apparatus switch protein [Pseudothauera nasutitermitis]|uniref:EscU/YscU/HrcU family type III secretion system export apparatus switch protein n=1 Tax=Pseudothauera nasutitermitis TaxID=2565930 RepID=UPI001E392271|nr:EscU/YscU/HrcU family type III secretion system export apparatus switch protein [Pseudothauera nasutitermitis]